MALNGTGTTTQLRDVETLQAIVVEGWFLLRQDERLVSLAMLIKIAEVRLACRVSSSRLLAKTNHLPECDQLVIGITFPAVYDAEARLSFQSAGRAYGGLPLGCQIGKVP